MSEKREQNDELSEATQYKKCKTKLHRKLQHAVNKTVQRPH